MLSTLIILPAFISCNLIFFTYFLGLKLDLPTNIHSAASVPEFRMCPTQGDPFHSPVVLEWTQNSLLHKSEWEEEEKRAI